MRVDQNIFRAYDVRGIYPSSLNETLAFSLGQAVAVKLREKGLGVIAVGRDARCSGQSLCLSLNEGLQSGGIAVIDVGRVPTPVLYFAAYHFAEGSGISITGSHNPPDYNGFKIMIGGRTLFGDHIQELHQLIAEGGIEASQSRHDIITRDAITPYCKRIKADFEIKHPLKIAIDCGNGIAGLVAKPLFGDLDHFTAVELFYTPDGNFPNHHPDPSQKENLQDLVATVKKEKCDFGVAFDGDGDRIGVVDEKGMSISPDRLLMLMAEDILSRNQGAAIVFDIKCSPHLARFITQKKGRPIMWKSGHSFIKNKMRQEKALLAGEMSGHIFFKERWFGFDDALYSACRLFEIIGKQERPMSQVFSEIPCDAASLELNIAVDDSKKFRVIEKLKRLFSERGMTMITIDGIRIEHEKGWSLIRCSNTSPNLVLYFGAQTKRALKEMYEGMIKDLLEVAPFLEKSITSLHF